jgi:hypothetical protein
VKLTLIKALALTAAIAGTAQVQAQTMDRASMMAACRMDYFRHCPTVMPGGGRIMACLNEVIDQISPGCAALVATGMSCAPDVKEFCADVEPRGDGMRNCLLSYRDELSGPCAAMLATAASQ